MTETRPDARTTNTAQRILNVAAELFFDEGYAATSVRRIMTACNVTPGALYNHYRSKEDVLFAILERSHNDSLAELHAARAATSGGAAAQLRAMVEALSLFHTDRQIEGLVSQREWRHLPPARAAVILERQREVRALFEDRLRLGVDNGEFHFDQHGVEVDIIAKGLLDLCINAGQWFRRTGRLDAGEIAKQHGELALLMAGAAD